MAEKFEKGETVLLKSGGPLMTVANVEEELIHTTWFQDGEQRFGEFDAALLVRDTGGYV